MAILIDTRSAKWGTVALTELDPGAVVYFPEDDGTARKFTVTSPTEARDDGVLTRRQWLTRQAALRYRRFGE